jgi:hypothetical protein
MGISVDGYQAKGRVVELTDRLVVPKADLAHACCCVCAFVVQTGVEFTTDATI